MSYQYGVLPKYESPTTTLWCTSLKDAQQFVNMHTEECKKILTIRKRIFPTDNKPHPESVGSLYMSYPFSSTE